MDAGAYARADFRGVRVTSPRTMPRAMELAATAVCLGVAGHVLGGSAVSPVVLLPAFIPLLLLARYCARRELNSTVILLTLVLGQVWVHMLASLTGHGQAMNGSSMLCGHAFTTFIAMVILRRREAVQWTKVRGRAIAAYVLAVMSFRDGFTLATPTPPQSQTSLDEIDPTSQFFACSIARRGPPSGLWG